MKDLSFLLGWFPDWPRPRWMDVSFPIIRIIIMIALLVLAVIMIICILFQTSTSGGMGAIAGQSTETFYSKNKGKSLQGVLKRLTIICAISVFVLAVLYLVSVQLYPVDYKSTSSVLLSVLRF